MYLRTAAILATASFATVLVVGCGTVRETLPGRSAAEQLLISTAADRAVSQLPRDPFAERAVFVDTSNLDCLDKPYVVQRIKSTLRENGAHCVPTADKADVVLEVAAGGLSIDKVDKLLGLPAIPIPMPFADETLKFPETPLWKLVTYRGRAKLLFSAVDPATGKREADLPTYYGQARDSYWWIFIVGPMRSTDLPHSAK